MEPADVYGISTLTFSTEVSVTVPRPGVVVLIGPNNVGKSTTLGELQGWIQQGEVTINNQPPKSLREVSEYFNPEQMLAWAKQFESGILPQPLRPEIRTLRNWGNKTTIDPAELVNRFQPSQTRSSISGFILSPGSCPIFSGPTPNYYNWAVQDGVRQFEDLYNSPEVEMRISQISQSVLGVPITMSRVGSHSILHFGQLPAMSNPPTDAQLQQLRAVPTVDSQGDGVRGFLGLALAMELGQEPIVILDEPDAHLHPPQAYHAGKFIATRGLRSQVFVVTHSLEFLHGILDSTAQVTVVRLNRGAGDAASVHVLSAEDLKSTWRDTSVRYSGALAGLMHRGVVLCEGHGDCRYFEVALDHLRAGESPHDLTFIDAGGKSGLKKLAAALFAIKVPVRCVVDFDFLRNWPDVSSLVESLGVDTEPFGTLWRQ